jgi:hypothetical protein
MVNAMAHAVAHVMAHKMANKMAHEMANKTAHEMALPTRPGMVRASAHEMAPLMRSLTKLGIRPSLMTLMSSAMWTGHEKVL